MKPNFLIIPYQLIEDKKITPLDEKVYGAIYWFEHLKDGICRASNKRIAETVNAGTGSVANSITRLSKEGYIQVYLDKKTRRRIQIKALVSFKKVSLSNEGGYHQRMKGVSLENEYNNNNINNKNKRISIEANASVGKQISVGKQVNELIDLFKEVNPTYERFFKMKGQREPLERLLKKYTYLQVKNMISFLPKIIDKPYAPQITTPYQLEQKLGNLIAYLKREKVKSKKGGVIII